MNIKVLYSLTASGREICLYLFHPFDHLLPSLRAKNQSKMLPFWHFTMTIFSSCLTKWLDNPLPAFFRKLSDSNSTCLGALLNILVPLTPMILIRESTRGTDLKDLSVKTKTPFGNVWDTFKIYLPLISSFHGVFAGIESTEAPCPSSS